MLHFQLNFSLLKDCSPWLREPSARAREAQPSSFGFGPPATPRPASHQSELDAGGKGLAVGHTLDEHDDRRGHGLGQLVSADRVVLQGEVGEDHEATEAERKGEDLARPQAFGGEDAQRLAHIQPEPGDGKVHQREAEVGEAHSHVQPFVQEDDANRRRQVY